jgi:hypothetical protein
MGDRRPTPDRRTIAAAFAWRSSWSARMAIAICLRGACVPTNTLDQVSFRERRRGALSRYEKEGRIKTGGSIYAIGVVGRQQVKIGLTREAVEERLRALQAEYPVPLALLGSVRVAKHLDRVKKHVHGFLAAQRLQGEWFAVAMDTRQLADLVIRAQRVLTAQRTSRKGVLTRSCSPPGSSKRQRA